jgi:hypothetical protein
MPDSRNKIVSIKDTSEFNLIAPLLPWMMIREVTSSESSTTIAYGDAVVFDLTATDAAAATFISTLAEARAMQAALGKVKQLATGVTSGVGSVCGVALESIAPAASGRIVTGGLVPKARITDADVAAGASLVGDGEAAGESEAYASATHTGAAPWGVALTSDTTNDGFVVAWMFPRGP